MERFGVRGMPGRFADGLEGKVRERKEARRIPSFLLEQSGQQLFLYWHGKGWRSNILGVK